LRYPKLLCAVVAIAFTVILLVVVPRFEPLFAMYSKELPLPTRALLFLGKVAKNYWFSVLMGALLVGVTFQILVALSSVRVTWERWRHSWPVIGSITKNLQVARLSATLGLLHKAGLPFLRALQIARASADAAYGDELRRIERDVEGGIPFHEAIAHSQLFSPLFIQMAAVGESTGNFDTLMKECARHHAIEAKEAMESNTQLIQPLLTFLLTFLILWLALAIFLPYWNMFSVAK
jgi:MSHA biogenesis protein MshG